MTISMDSNSKAAAAAAADTAASDQGRRWQRKHVLKAVCDCLLVAIQLVQSCSGVSQEEPRRRRLQAFVGIALSYAAAVALTLFARRLEARGLGQRRHGREQWLNAAARVLASLVLLFGLPIWRTGYLMACGALFTFIWRYRLVTL